jgi:hypothetical protein
MLKPMAKVIAETYQCQYCKKDFARENSLVVHMCEQKRRFSEQGEKGVKLGLLTYNKFYQHTQNRNKTKSFEEFAKSPYYKAFVKFGRYVTSSHCIAVERFIRFVITSNIKLDNWAKDSTYTKFLDDLIKKENVQEALVRSIESSIEWGNDKNMQPQDMLRYGSENRICQWVNAGKVSPWALYHSQSGVKLIQRLSSEQRTMIWDMIDPEYWDGVFSSRTADVAFAEEILKEAGW